MPPPPLSVAVVIPCRNEAATITALLDAIAGQTRVPDEVVVANDGSADGTVDTIRAWHARTPGVSLRIVDSGGRGAGAAMNAGITATPCDVIVRLDGHCLPDASYVARCLETLAAPDAGVAGGVWRIEPGGPDPIARGIAAVLAHPLGSGGADYRHHTPHDSQAIRDVDTVPFGAFPRSVWTEVGGFDEGLLRNQDYDFNYRVRQTGRRVLLNPAIVSVYRARASLSRLARQYFQYGYWKVRMLRKFPSSIRPRQLLPMLLLPALAVSLALAVIGFTPVLWPVAAYAAINAIGGLQASARVRDPRVAPAAAIALVVLQTAWSAGAWLSIVGYTDGGDA